ncbi:hypothetical protein ACQKE8_26555, partial [Sphingobium limneticum]
MRGLILLGIPGLVIGMGSASAQTVSREDAMRAAIHPSPLAGRARDEGPSRRRPPPDGQFAAENPCVA